MPASWTRDTCNQPFAVANLGGFTSFWRAFSGLIGDGMHKLFPDTWWSQPAPKTKRRTKVLNLFWLLAILFHQFLTLTILTINTIHDSSHLKWTRSTPWLILTSSWHVLPFTDSRVKFTIFAWSPYYILLLDGFLPLKWTQWFPNPSVMVGISFSLGVLPLNLHPSSVRKREAQQVERARAKVRGNDSKTRAASCPSAQTPSCSLSSHFSRWFTEA